MLKWNANEGERGLSRTKVPGPPGSVPATADDIVACLRANLTTCGEVMAAMGWVTDQALAVTGERAEQAERSLATLRELIHTASGLDDHRYSAEQMVKEMAERWQGASDDCEKAEQALATVTAERDEARAANRDNLAMWEVERDSMRERWNAIDMRISDIADEAFGPFPTEPPDELLSRIEKGIFTLRQSASEWQNKAEREADEGERNRAGCVKLCQAVTGSTNPLSGESWVDTAERHIREAEAQLYQMGATRGNLLSRAKRARQAYEELCCQSSNDELWCANVGEHDALREEVPKLRARLAKTERERDEAKAEVEGAERMREDALRQLEMAREVARLGRIEAENGRKSAKRYQGERDEAKAIAEALRAKLAKTEKVVDAARKWSECVERGFAASERPDVARARVLRALRALDDSPVGAGTDSGGSGAANPGEAASAIAKPEPAGSSHAVGRMVVGGYGGMFAPHAVALTFADRADVRLDAERLRDQITQWLADGRRTTLFVIGEWSPPEPAGSFRLAPPRVDPADLTDEPATRAEVEELRREVLETVAEALDDAWVRGIPHGGNALGAAADALRKAGKGFV